MREWEVKEGRSVRGFSDESLRRMLRSGSLTGAELVRPLRGEWVRLYELPLFADELADDRSPRAIVLPRAGWRLAAHLAIFLVVVGVVREPALAGIWLFFLAAHAWRDGPLIVAAARAPTRRVDRLTAARPLVGAVRGLLAQVDGKPAAAELATALRGLEQAGEELGRRVVALELVARPEELEDLRSEQQQVEARLDTTRDARTRQVLTKELGSLATRIASLGDAVAELERLRAEERSLHHQVEALRVELARGAAQREGAVDLLGRIDELRARARAEAEVEGLRVPER
jgi:hypothetical protein